MNVVLLQGVLSSEPRERTLASGSTLIAWEVTTPDGDQKRSVPVVWFDPTRTVRMVGAGDEVVVLGSVRRRFFRAGGATTSRTEVIGSRAALSRRPKRADQIRDAAVARIDSMLTPEPD